MKQRTRPYSWMHPALREKKSANGIGTFAEAEIPMGTLIVIFGGYVISVEEESDLPEAVADIGIQVERNFIIGPILSTSSGNGDFINHSCEPTAGIRGQISLYTLRKVQ